MAGGRGGVRPGRPKPGVGRPAKRLPTNPAPRWPGRAEARRAPRAPCPQRSGPQPAPLAPRFRDRWALTAQVWRPPEHAGSLLGALLGVGGHGRAEALTVPSSVTGARVVDAGLIEGLGVHLGEEPPCAQRPDRPHGARTSPAAREAQDPRPALLPGHSAPAPRRSRAPDEAARGSWAILPPTACS